MVNPAMVAMLGYDSAEELLQVDLAQDVYVDSDQRAEIVADRVSSDRLESGAVVEWRRKDGAVVMVRLNGRMVRDEEGKVECFEMIAEDVTEQRKLEEQFRQAQKMEAVGRLAGGVAHDFNNVLTVISGECELALLELEDQHPMRIAFEGIQAAGNRAAALTRQLLTFSRKQLVEPTVFTPNDLVIEMEKMLGRFSVPGDRLETR